MILAYRQVFPRLCSSVFVAPGARIIGDVEIGAESSVWFGAVIRGDLNSIRIGERTSIQDNSVLHVDTGRRFMRIGDGVTVGHGVVLHGCTIGNRCLVGMGAVIMNESIIGEGCIVGAGSLVAEGTRVEERTLLVGVPARPKRAVTDADLERIDAGVREYQELSRRYLPLSENTAPGEFGPGK